jgi:hypothetical protein
MLRLQSSFFQSSTYWQQPLSLAKSHPREENKTYPDFQLITLNLHASYTVSIHTVIIMVQ